MRRPTLVALALLAALALPAGAQNCIVPRSQIVSGGPGKDGIPALSRPQVVSAAEGDALYTAETLVLGVTLNGESRAYPHNILWWHEIVNDVLGGTPITVSYCPLTGSGMVYDPVLDGRAVEFGVSGLLFDNNLILYDRTANESLWSQLRAVSVCGPRVGAPLPLRPVTQTTWAAWRALHPETSVLSLATGHRRNYSVYPYGRYDQLDDRGLLFPHSFLDERRPLKELVFGVTHAGVARAYPYTALGERAAINDDVNGRAVLVVFDSAAALALGFDRIVAGETLSFDAVEAVEFPFHLRDRETGSLWSLDGVALEGPLAGAQLPRIATYSAMWFAWASFHRGSEIFLP